MLMMIMSIVPSEASIDRKRFKDSWKNIERAKIKRLPFHPQPRLSFKRHKVRHRSTMATSAAFDLEICSHR